MKRRLDIRNLLGAKKQCFDTEQATKQSDADVTDNRDVDLGDGAVIAYFPREISAPEAAGALQALEGLAWKSTEIRVYGRNFLQPRLIYYMADEGVPDYSYSKTRMVPETWTPEVLHYKEVAERLSGTTFNTCLLNKYRDGRDCVGWHADDEKQYGDNPTIVSVSFGTPRDFYMRKKADHSRKAQYTLGAGDIFIMRGMFQVCPKLHGLGLLEEKLQAMGAGHASQQAQM